ncbi:lysine--tRNA ligase [Candidatus Riesia pediculischaeffi]|uniref:lysine--tRNA ligase n=1 Tax=Candidatus Riesia pediculischaeffi TaxID=428411 RepID=UPI0009B7367E|nr:lysine--tRNA ligase [Candidatus Riesia pediculischaeffi]
MKTKIVGNNIRRYHSLCRHKGFKRDHLSKDLYNKFYQIERKKLISLENHVSVAGRMISRRILGRASFFTLRDFSGTIQVYVSVNTVKEKFYEHHFKKWNLGDIVGVYGRLFKTKVGELTIDCQRIYLLSKSYRTISSKFYRLKNREIQHRNRCLDLISNEDSKEIFIVRSKIINWIRQFMNRRGFIEVETPIMQPIPGGALAKPFITHHNTLNTELYLRISPELYLKRLIIGGFEKIFEIGKNFRNEGISRVHNPEFTMMEMYEVYKNYLDLMKFVELLLKKIARSMLKTSKVKHGENFLDFDKDFEKITMKESILRNISDEFSEKDLNDKDKIIMIAKSYEVKIDDTDQLGKIQYKIFEKVVEKKLVQPTFVTEYPIEVSPLSKRKEDDPSIAERFELFIGGYEVANGFSELNDPIDQLSRFIQQRRENRSGVVDQDYSYDEDYISALEYGLPPTAGLGIGIDRLVMLLTDRCSIRDVIFFPILRKNDT